jgi:hypothetical protein
VAFAAAALTLALGLGATIAAASVSIVVAWDALLHESTAAAIATPVEAQSVWENGRIYTYTHVKVERRIAGSVAPGEDAWVRTMGGVVGQIGQIVEGEPVFAAGSPCLLFLHPVSYPGSASGPTSAYEVTARAQGQFPVQQQDPAAPPRLIRSRNLGALLPRNDATASPRLAADVIHGRAVDDVAREITTDWVRTHAP